MKVIDPELRYRMQVVESTIEDVVESLGSRGVRDALGDYAHDLSAIADGLYVPNIQGARISIPREYRETNQTPIFALRAGERYRTDDTLAALKPVQQLSLQRDIGISPLAPHIEDHDTFAARAATKLVATNVRYDGIDLYQNDRTVGGFVSVQSVSVSRERPSWSAKKIVAVRSLPIVGLMLNNYNDAERNIIAVHELTHVLQREQSPAIIVNPIDDLLFRPSQLQLDEELEAYAVGAHYCLAMASDGAHEYEQGGIAQKHIQIERLRPEYTKEKAPFRVSRKFKRILGESGLKLTLNS